MKRFFLRGKRERNDAPILPYLDGRTTTGLNPILSTRRSVGMMETNPACLRDLASLDECAAAWSSTLPIPTCKVTYVKHHLIQLSAHRFALRSTCQWFFCHSKASNIYSVCHVLEPAAVDLIPIDV
jgi:hypothetical protein